MSIIQFLIRNFGDIGKFLALIILVLQLAAAGGTFPIETIDKGFIAFTTTNPDNRYIRMTNVKVNNNLRDFYYRDIVLGEQSEPVYNSTNNYEIALAFREAGEAFGSQENK